MMRELAIVLGSGLLAVLVWFAIRRISRWLGDWSADRQALAYARQFPQEDLARVIHLSRVERLRTKYTNRKNEERLARVVGLK